MSSTRIRPARRLTMTVGSLLAATLVVAGCTGNDPDEDTGSNGGTEAPVAGGGNDETGETVGFF